MREAIEALGYSAIWHGQKSWNGVAILSRVGEPVETRYDFTKADVIVSLDADFLYAGYPGNTRYIRDFVSRRNPDKNMSRFYAIESTPTSTGAKADHRLPVRASEIEKFARGLSKTIGPDLTSHKGSSLIIPGEHQPPVVHALAHALNAEFDNVGKTVFYTDPVDANPVNQTESLKDLVADMRGGKVDMLIILGGNPAYDAPAELDQADRLAGGARAERIVIERSGLRRCQRVHGAVGQHHETARHQRIDQRPHGANFF